MNDRELRALLCAVFNDYKMMRGRDYHTLNELLYVMRTDSRMKGFNFNINIIRRNGSCLCIPSIDAFVSVAQLGIWFTDYVSECDVEEIDNDGELYVWHCITIYEAPEEVIL